MPFQLARSDRNLLLACGSLLLVMIVASLFLGPSEEQGPGFASSYSTASGGAKAAYLLLSEVGIAVERWERSPTDLPSDPTGVTLVLADSYTPSSRDEREALRSFLARGGRVLAAGPHAAFLLPQGDVDFSVPFHVTWEKFRALAPSRISRGAPEISMRPQASWRMKHTSHLPLYGDEAKPVVVQYRVGRGEVIWWAAPTPLTNAGLRNPGSPELLLNCLGDSRRVLWDEYFHGQRKSLWALAGSTPLPWALAQLGLLAVAVLLTYSRRAGPVRRPRAESRLSPLEFVETLGGLYRRSHAAPVAVEIAYKHFRFLLTRRLGMPPQATVDDLERGVRERLRYREPGFRETLLRAEAAINAPELSDKEAVPIVRALHGYAREFRLAERT